jgi:phage-related protein
MIKILEFLTNHLANIDFYWLPPLNYIVRTPLFMASLLSLWKPEKISTIDF